MNGKMNRFSWNKSLGKMNSAEFFENGNISYRMETDDAGGLSLFNYDYNGRLVDSSYSKDTVTKPQKEDSELQFDIGSLENGEFKKGHNIFMVLSLNLN